MRKNVLLLFFYFLTCFSVLAQSDDQAKEIIRIGVKTTIPDSIVKEKIINNEYNFIDAFEYELLEYLKLYMENNEKYVLEFVPVIQNNKLDEVKKGKKIDALLFTFSETQKRKDIGIHFSAPYFQNKAISIIVNNPKFDIKNLGNVPMRVGTVNNTTTEAELNNLRNRYKDNLLVLTYKTHTELIDALRAKEIDGAAGDVSRLIYDVNDGNFYFGGNLPTRRSKIRDNYAIAITPNKPELVEIFNKFILDSQKKIQRLEQKWLSTAIEDAYSSYYNKEEDKLKEVIYYIIAGALIIVIVIMLYFNYILKRKDRQLLEKEKQIKNIEEEKTDIKVGNIISSFHAKSKAKIGADDIARIGIDFFKKAKEITYVGSGGFLSDPDLGEEWSEALHGFLNKPDTILKRVIDLPAMDINDNREANFPYTENFFPNKLYNQYKKRYLKWLCIQYHDLNNYKNLKIINSRGAALWGYGIVIIIKDREEVLIFTTNEDTKVGSSIINEDLAGQISKVISKIADIGTASLTVSNFAKMFFDKDQRLIDMRKRLDAKKGERICKKMLDEIDEVCDYILNS